MTTRVIIVGSGVAGAATAYWLGRERSEPCEVVLVEGAARIGVHSSGRNAAILRVAANDAVTRALAVESAAFYEAPPADLAEQPLVDPVGVLIARGDDAPPWAAPLIESGHARLVGAGERLALAPHVRLGGDHCYWFPGSGVLPIERLLHAFVRGAERSGATLLTGVPVAALLVDSEAVRGVQLADGRRLVGDAVVLAAGAWSAELGRAAGARSPLVGSLRHLFVTAPDRGADPRAPVVWDEQAGFYARPFEGGYLICACDTERLEGVPDPDHYPLDPDTERRAVRLATEHLVASEAPRVVRGWSGLRDLSPDDRPLVGPDARVAGLFWCAGHGGHGMSIAAGVGRATAAAVLGRPHPLLGHLDPRRHAATTEESESASRTSGGGHG